MSRFPKLTETFVLFEMEAVERRGVAVELFPLLRERSAVVHPEAAPWVARAHYLAFLSPAVAASNLVALVRRPVTYLRAALAVVVGAWGSLNFLVGGLAIFPKAVHAGRMMERLGVRHVHCHFANHPAVAGLVIRRLTGIPFSFTAHGSDLHKDRHMLPQKVREAAFVVAISEDNRRVIVEECGAGAGRVEVVHCGVDTERFTPVAGLPERRDEELRVVCVGTLHEVKGQAVLLDACTSLAAEGVAVGCTFVGDGPDRADLEARAAAAGLGGRVRFAGRLTQPEVLEELRRADVLAAPSVPTRSGRREGIPVVLMEAMAAGVPVVASRLSGIPELVEDGTGGLLVPPGDAAALAAALVRLRDPDLRRRLAEGGRRRVVAEFDVDRNAARLVDLIEIAGRA